MKKKFIAMLAALALWGACRPSKPAPDDPAIWQKVKIDFRQFDENGLTGPPNGKVAAHYEFCIPASEEAWRAVQKIDPTAQKNAGRGRVGCGKGEQLVIGTTQQKNYKRVLYELARLGFVREIQQTFWE